QEGAAVRGPRKIPCPVGARNCGFFHRLIEGLGRAASDHFAAPAPVTWMSNGFSSASLLRM
ncbi:MAG: hypothetical protein OSW77_04335, partial [Proteobacteria bacterium]|nr:hypothetical protein [Pseudomonadota bacterium]